MDPIGIYSMHLNALDPRFSWIIRTSPWCSWLDWLSWRFVSLGFFHLEEVAKNDSIHQQALKRSLMMSKRGHDLTNLDMIHYICTCEWSLRIWAQQYGQVCGVLWILWVQSYPWNMVQTGPLIKATFRSTWWFQLFSIFSPKTGEMFQFHLHIVQGLWIVFTSPTLMWPDLGLSHTGLVCRWRSLMTRHGMVWETNTKTRAPLNESSKEPAPEDRPKLNAPFKDLHHRPLQLQPFFPGKWLFFIVGVQ